jgi:hypothetical protein
VEDVLSRGTIEGEFLEISEEEYAALKAKYRPKPELPSVATMAKNAAAAAAKEIGARLSGTPEVPEEEIARRLETCHGCELFIQAQGRCSKCGCFMKFKSRLRSQHCPENKW